jgi:murein DD-endopeptidase MepM/ murein hydrolase activator NlpD
MKYIILLALTISCSGIKTINKDKEIAKIAVQKELPLVETIHEVTLRPGKATFVEFNINLADGKIILSCNKKKISFVVLNKKAKTLMGESYFSKLKPYKCMYNNKEVLSVKVRDFPYKSEKLNVNKSRVTLSKKNLARVIKEREIKRKVYLKSSSYFLFNEPFMTPLNSYITSHYGNRRLFNNKKRSQHLGNDFRAAVGVPIPMANKGKVVYTGNLFYSGNVVIVDHGLNIFTAYGHLSKIKVQVGTIVNKGDIVGLAGKTGRVSGPHLHWGVKINGSWIDGFSLVEESKKM